MSTLTLQLSVTAFVTLFLLSWVSSLAQRLKSIENTTKTDPLTGLGSAILLETERWYAALRSRQPLGVAWIDLDGLKGRNDREGHLAGDQLIREAAQAITQGSRRGVDEVFRMHTKGDEFVVLFHGLLDPVRVAAAIVRALERHNVSASGGFAYTTELGFLPKRADLRMVAEMACRAAKERGGRKFVVERSDIGERFLVDSAGGQPIGGAASVLSATCGSDDGIPVAIEDGKTTKLLPGQEFELRSAAAVHS